MNWGFLIGTLIVIVSIHIAYILFLGLVLVSPTFQRAFVYLHWLKYPRGLLHLDKFFLVHIARNVECWTKDGEVLRGWHIVPTRLGPELVKLPIEDNRREQRFDALLADGDAPVIVVMHGQAGGRGLQNRLETCRALAGQLQAHVVIFDYRGFADSTGSPSQRGLLQDAEAIWEWVGDRRSAGCFLYGQSLGAAVCTHFASQLEDRGGEPFHRLKGLILDAPFDSLGAAMKVHPLLLPFRCLPQLQDLLVSKIADPWNSANAISGLSVPILILSAGRDAVVGIQSAANLHLAATRGRGERAVLAEIQGTVMDQDVRFARLDGTTHHTTHRCCKWLAELSDFIADAGARHPQTTSSVVFEIGEASGVDPIALTAKTSTRESSVRKVGSTHTPSECELQPLRKAGSGTLAANS